MNLENLEITIIILISAFFIAYALVALMQLRRESKRNEERTEIYNLKTICEDLTVKVQDLNMKIELLQEAIDRIHDCEHVATCPAKKFLDNIKQKALPQFC